MAIDTTSPAGSDTRMLHGIFTPIREDSSVTLDFNATDAAGTKFAFSIPLLGNDALRRVHIVTWDGEQPHVTAELLRQVRAKALEYVEAHQDEIDALVRR